MTLSALRRHAWRALRSAAAMTILLPWLHGCGNGTAANASQVAAKVNKEEITVHQINYVLQRQPGLKADQVESTRRDVLERLIDQELAVQRAVENKIDRDPQVRQEIEASRRDVIARAYLNYVGERAARPSDAEVDAYYKANPQLFSRRQIYTLRELALEADPAPLAELQALLPKAKSYQEITDFLKAHKIAGRISQNATPAESLPLTLLEPIGKLTVGQSLYVPAPHGARIVTLLQSQAAPVSEEQARPAIELFLLNERKRKLVEQDLETIRSGAHIEYVGHFEPAKAEPTEAKTSGAAAAQPTEAPTTAGGNDALSKGLAGLR